MSLIGSLEDLSLGDILQIISLSQKSGVLVLRTESGDGRVSFRNGLVCGALVKDGPGDLRGLLVESGVVTDVDFDAALRASDAEGAELSDQLVADGHVAADQLEALKREAVEQAVVTMFRWRSGEFSFDVREEAEPEDPPIFAPAGINAQYLAMEGARFDDEANRDAGAAFDPFGGAMPGARMEIVDEGTDGPGPGEEASPLSLATLQEEAVPHEDAAPQQEAAPRDDEPVDPGSPDESDLPEAAIVLDADPHDSEVGEPIGDAIVEAVEDGEVVPPLLDAAEVEMVDEPLALAEPEALVPEESAQLHAMAFECGPEDEEGPGLVAEAVERVALSAASRVDGDAGTDAPAGVGGASAAIVIDDDLVALEWAKETLKTQFSTVHIFQRQDLGLARIRQYLARAEHPCVLVSADVAGDPLSGIADGPDFVRRLKQQAPAMPVLWLGQYGAGLPELGAADGAVRRPSSAELRDPRAVTQRNESAAALCVELARALEGRDGEGSAQAAAQDEPEAGPALDELRDVTQRLRDASTRGEVLPLVLSYAHQRFARVALFAVRDECVVGLIARGSGVREDAVQGLELGRDECKWFARALDGGSLVQNPPEDAGDQCIVAALGGTAPGCATIAPIESSGRIVALLYGDGGAGCSASRVDTAALEVVLHHAGLALDRAALERALNES